MEFLTVSTAIAFFGGVLIIVSILSKLKTQWIDIELNGFQRFLFSLLGVFLIFMGFGMHFSEADKAKHMYVLYDESKPSNKKVSLKGKELIEYNVAILDIFFRDRSEKVDFFTRRCIEKIESSNTLRCEEYDKEMRYSLSALKDAIKNRMIFFDKLNVPLTVETLKKIEQESNKLNVLPSSSSYGKVAANFIDVINSEEMKIVSGSNMKPRHNK